MTVKLPEIPNPFKKAPMEKLIEKKVNSMLFELMSNNHFDALQTIQILNGLRRKVSEHYKVKRDEAMEQSVNSSQFAKEIGNALTYIE